MEETRILEPFPDWDIWLCLDCGHDWNSNVKHTCPKCGSDKVTEGWFKDGKVIPLEVFRKEVRE